jgi:hypothetical protein
MSSPRVFSLVLLCRICGLTIAGVASVSGPARGLSVVILLPMRATCARLLLPGLRHADCAHLLPCSALDSLASGKCVLTRRLQGILQLHFQFKKVCGGLTAMISHDKPGTNSACRSITASELLSSASRSRHGIARPRNRAWERTAFRGGSGPTEATPARPGDPVSDEPAVARMISADAAAHRPTADRPQSELMRVDASTVSSLALVV